MESLTQNFELYAASECLEKMKQLVRQLETSLGPETGDLSMRIGLHRYVNASPSIDALVQL